MDVGDKYDIDEAPQFKSFDRQNLDFIPQNVYSY
jgi:hypothetical protein